MNVKQHIQKYFAIKRKNNQGVFWTDAFKDTRLSAQSAASNKSSWNKKLLLEEEKARRAGKMGEVVRGAFLFLGASLFILYSICIVLQLAARVSQGRLNQKKSQETERPRREYQVTKDLLHHVHNPLFRQEQCAEEEKRWSKIGRARWGRRGCGWAGVCGWHITEKYTL